MRRYHVLRDDAAEIWLNVVDSVQELMLGCGRGILVALGGIAMMLILNMSMGCSLQGQRRLTGVVKLVVELHVEIP